MAVDTRKTEAPKGRESTAYTWVAVCSSEDLPPGEVRQLKVRNKELAVGRLETGQLFAVAGRCTHLRARLGKGKIDGSLLECPWHGAKFDVTDGCVAIWVQHPGWLKAFYDAAMPFALKRAVTTYDVKEENGEVHVAVD